MTKTFDPDRSLGVLISDVARLLRRNFDRRLQSLGLTQAQWRAIVHVSRTEGMNQVALAECLEAQPITVARLIDRMESAGWIERRNDPLDRRAVQLFLTPKCQPILEEIHARAAEMMSTASWASRKRAEAALRESAAHETEPRGRRAEDARGRTKPLEGRIAMPDENRPESSAPVSAASTATPAAAASAAAAAGRRSQSAAPARRSRAAAHCAACCSCSGRSSCSAARCTSISRPAASSAPTTRT